MAVRYCNCKLFVNIFFTFCENPVIYKVKKDIRKALKTIFKKYLDVKFGSSSKQSEQWSMESFESFSRDDQGRYTWLGSPQKTIKLNASSL